MSQSSSFAASGFAEIFMDSKSPAFFDLSHTLDESTPIWPGDPLVEARRFAELESDGFQGTRYAFGTHTGTHLDFPRHYFTDGEPLDAFAPETFLRQAAVIDLEPLLDLSNESAALISDELLTLFESVFRRFSAVLFRTGWGRRWGKPGYFDDFPSLTTAAAEWLCDFDLTLLGVETPSLAAPSLWRGAEDSLSDDAACHRTLLGRTPPILLLENLAGLDRLDAITAAEAERPSFDGAERGVTLACFPLKFMDADGSPVRAVAWR